MKFPQPIWIQSGKEAAPLRESRIYFENLKKPLYVYHHNSDFYVTDTGVLSLEEKDGFFRLCAFDNALGESPLGSTEFLQEHHLHYPYIFGGMAHGIASVKMVVHMAKAGFMGFFGTGGLSLDQVEKSILEIQKELSGAEPYGINMMSLNPEHDQKMVDLLFKYQVRKVEVAGAIVLTPAVVEYRLKGCYRGPDGRVITPNKIFAKLSREEVASLFMAPPPEKILQQLLQAGRISPEEAELAREIPVAEEVIAEADSGGHTDNRPALLLFQNMVNLRNQMMEKYQYPHARIRLGAAGGICTPYTVLAAFTLGADFVVTGSINQSCLEANTSDVVKQMLCQMSMSDVANAPSADMFEMGSKVQVLSKGVMFHLKANKLYEVYQNYKSIEEIPTKIREQLEEKTFRASLDHIWESTKKYFQEKQPEVITRAEQNSKYKMALIFRWYLGLATSWAQKGEVDRKVDFQIFCGPGMGAFNRWAKGTYLEHPENRKVVDIALNLIEGAYYLRRIQFLREQGMVISPEIARIIPKPRREIDVRGIFSCE